MSPHARCNLAHRTRSTRFFIAAITEFPEPKTWKEGSTQAIHVLPVLAILISPAVIEITQERQLIYA
jgi:hypothetical protein